MVAALLRGGGIHAISSLYARSRNAMTVFIDDMYRYAIGQFRGMRMSHMIADDEVELHAMADHIGMHRRWYQGDHYDVPLDRRSLAVAAGAVTITYRQCGMMRRRHQVEGTCGRPQDAATWYRSWQVRRRAGINTSLG